MAPELPPHPEPDPLEVESVGFAVGAGRLVRRPTAVLFDVGGDNTKLSSEFDAAASDADAIALVLQAVIDADFGLAPLAIVGWRGDLELVAFGDIELHTSLRSAPMISGASSTSWVERRVRRHVLDGQSSIQVWAGGAPEPGTNLRLGVAACSGFRLDLANVTTPQTAEPVHASPAAPKSSSFEPAAVAAGPDDGFDRDDTDADPFSITPASPAAAPGPSATATAMSSDLLEFDPGRPAESAPPSSQPEQSEPAISRPELAEEMIATIGVLLFDNLADLADVTVTAPLVIGRRPEALNDMVAVVVDHPEVSRSHAAIGIDGWAVTLTDLESRNGTWVHPPTDEGLRRLDPGERIVLIDGTIVHLGSIDVCFTWQAATPTWEQ